MRLVARLLSAPGNNAAKPVIVQMPKGAGQVYRVELPAKDCSFPAGR
jgi:hypothetical protein